MRYTAHCEQMLSERGIHREWAERTLLAPDRTEDRPDGTRHYIKQIPEHGGRWLRLVISGADGSPTCVTAFFDRRLRKTR
jgi:hypothetical protein